MLPERSERADNKLDKLGLCVAPRLTQPSDRETVIELTDDIRLAFLLGEKRKLRAARGPGRVSPRQ